MSNPLFEKRSAIFSECRQYRHMLRIVWNDSLPAIAFVGLNPSTADEFADDPTIRRIKTFAKEWGYGSLLMFNLFAFKATDPKDMYAAADPVGPIADLGTQIRLHDPRETVACWGTHGSHRGRGAEVAQQLAKHYGGNRLVCLGFNQDSSPKHPLYLRADSARVPFPRRDEAVQQ